MTSSRRVLLAEDDSAIAEPLARALTREGNECEIAATGPEALEKVLTGDYDLLILDLGLPGMDGPRCAAGCAPSCRSCRC